MIKRKIRAALPGFFVILCQKALQNTLFRFFGGQTQRFQLQELVTGDLADGGLVDQLRLRAVGHNGGMDWIWALSMMIESHCTWPKQAALPTILG